MSAWQRPEDSVARMRRLAGLFAMQLTFGDVKDLGAQGFSHGAKQRPPACPLGVRGLIQSMGQWG